MGRRRCHRPPKCSRLVDLPKAAAARAAYEAVRRREHEALLACQRQELVQGGYEADVTIAAEVEASIVVPVLPEARFTDASRV